MSWIAQLLSILLRIILPHFLFGYSQIFLMIMSFHALHTCLQLSRVSRLLCPIINNISSKMRSGNPIIMNSRICVTTLSNSNHQKNIFSCCGQVSPVPVVPSAAIEDCTCRLCTHSDSGYISPVFKLISYLP